VTPADAPNRLDESLQPMACNNDTEQLTRAILEIKRATLEGGETQKKILALLDQRIPVLEDRPPRATTRVSPAPSGKTSVGRPPYDLELMLYAALVHLAVERGFTTDEALNSLIREVAKKRGLSPISRETLKKRLKALRQRMPRPL
jgi:hypothetical protein